MNWVFTIILKRENLCLNPRKSFVGVRITASFLYVYGDKGNVQRDPRLVSVWITTKPCPLSSPWMPQGLFGVDQRIRAGWPRQYRDAEPLTCLSIHFLQGRCQWMDSCATWAEKKTESFHLRNWIWTKTCLSPCLTISSIPHTTPTSQVRCGRVLTVRRPALPDFTL